jgi:tetratricopeptide (TPR) repeat protein
MALILLLLMGTLFQDSEGVDPQALEWFYKGQELIGTSQEYSREQAEYFERAVELDPDFAAARYNLAVIYINQKKGSLALQQLNAWIDVKPEDPRGYLLRARVRLEANETDEAAEDLERALEFDSENYEAWQWLGRIHYQRGQYKEASHAFEEVLRLSPNPVEAYFDVALVQQAVGQTEEAIVSYQKFLIHFPEDFQANYHLGLLYRETGRDDLALEHFMRAEEKEPDHPQLAQELADLYLDRNDHEEARRRLLGASQESVVSLANLGIIAKREGQNSQAMQYFERALEKDPQNALLWAHLGDVLFELQRSGEAAEAYENALRHNPEDVDVLSNLGTLYAHVGRVREAIDLLKRALSIDSCHGQAHYSMAVVLDRTDAREAAQTHYLRSVDCGADNAYAHLRLAFLFARKEDRSEALRHLEIAFQKNPEEYVPAVVSELRKVRSDLDSIRYTKDLRDLLLKYRGTIPAAEAP